MCHWYTIKKGEFYVDGEKYKETVTMPEDVKEKIEKAKKMLDEFRKHLKKDFKTVITNVTIKNPDVECRVFIISDENPRTINTPQNGRVYYTMRTVKAKDLMWYIANCINNNVVIDEIRIGLNTIISVSVDPVNSIVSILK